MNQKKKIWIGVIVITVLVLSGVWFWALRPEPRISVPIDSTIEKMAEENGIPVIEVNYLKNEFAKDQGFGGAGGIGTPVIGVKNAQQFFDIINKEPGTKVLYANEKTDTEGLTRRYWGINSETMVITEFTEHYTSPGGKFGYKVDRVTNDAVIFEKSYTYCSAWAICISIVFIPLALIPGREMLEYFSYSIKTRRERKKKIAS